MDPEILLTGTRGHEHTTIGPEEEQAAANIPARVRGGQSERKSRDGRRQNQRAGGVCFRRNDKKKLAACH